MKQAHMRNLPECRAADGKAGYRAFSEGDQLTVARNFGESLPSPIMLNLAQRVNPRNSTKKPKRTARVNTGISTNELIFSAYAQSNDAIFPHILKLYVSKGSTVADVTWGKGVFWKRVESKDYALRFSDLKTDVPKGIRGGTDSRRLPYDDAELDAIVFDPPYMHTPGGTAHNGHQNFEDYYQNNAAGEVDEEINESTGGNPPKYHEAVLDLYFRSAREAFRCLKPEGVYIVKCQDEVCTNRQRLTHVELINELVTQGFIVEDLFVAVRTNKPGVSRMKKQYHARKNHSYFLVFRKPRLKKTRGSSTRGRTHQKF